MLFFSEKPADEEDGSDSFVDKLAAQIVKNLKVLRLALSLVGWLSCLGMEHAMLFKGR